MDDKQGRLDLELRSESPSEPVDRPDDLVEGLHDLLLGLRAEGDRSHFERDTHAAALAASLRMATEDSTLSGGPSLDPAVLIHAPDKPVAVPSGDQAAAMRISLIDTIVASIRNGDVELGRILSSLAIYGGPFQDLALAAISSLAADGVIEGTDGIDPTLDLPAGRPVAAHLISVVPGDTEELVIALAYPDDPAGRSGVSIVLETYAGRRPIDVLICDDVADFLDEAREAVSELAVPEALGRLATAFRVFDRTIGAVDGLHEDSDLLMLRPIIDRLLATDPNSNSTWQPEPVSEQARLDAADSFVAWLDDHDPEFDQSTLAFVPLLVDLVADRADDPLRWSAVVAVNTLETVCRQVAAPPDELALVPDLVRAMVAWAHERNAWPPDVTAETMAAIDHVQPLFDAELAELANTDAASANLIVPPGGGTHPEPFEDKGLPGQVRGRSGLIAQVATERSIELFDPEFATLVRRFVADAARTSKTPLVRGKIEIWAAGAIYAVAQLNEIPGGWSPLARPAAEITAALDGAPATITNKARELRQLLDADRFPPEPRYQHSTSAGATADLRAGLLGSIPGVRPGLHLVEPLQSLEPESVDPSTVDGDCYVLRIAIADIRPEIWRRVRVPVDATFGQLHQVIQLVFGWYDCHLHGFEVSGERVGPAAEPFGFDDGAVDEDALRLCDAVTVGTGLVYVYDFGDNWEHEILIEAVEDLDARTDIVTGRPMGPFALLDGKRSGPPEDCGGWPGYTELLQAMKDKRHPRRQELMEWLPTGFDPNRLDVYTVNQAVAAAAKRWR